MSVTNKLIGKILSNRYEILRPLGEGGMGKVYLAKDKRFGKQVVVKVPTMEAGDKDFKDRFMREIASLATLEHPHIVTTVDWGEIEGIPFLVLRYLGGGSLRDRITDAQGYYKAMPLEDLSQWLPQIASALDFIHTKNWVHRDLKPDNILFDEAGNPYLADFGIAKALECAPMGVKTILGAFIGTPQYMAPEMHLGKGIGPRADQFGLAVLVYEALSGKIPFNGITPTAIFVEVMQGKAKPIHELVPGIPIEKSNALMKGITKEPRDRYGNCVEFANAVMGSMLARGSFLESNETPFKSEIAGTRIETPLSIPLAVPVSTPLEISGTRIETPSKPKIEGTRIEIPPPIPLVDLISSPLEIPGTRSETPSKPKIEGTRIEIPPPIPLEITDSIIEEVPEYAKNTDETKMQPAQSDPEEFNYDSNLYPDLALTTEDYLTESGQLLAQLCRDLIEKEKMSKGWWVKASRFFKKHDVSQILGGKALLEKMGEINKLGRVSREISDDVVQLAVRILKEKKPLIENKIENLFNLELAEAQIIDKVKNPPSKILLIPRISLGQSSVFVGLLMLLFLIFGKDFNWQQEEDKNNTQTEMIQAINEGEQTKQEEEAKAKQMELAKLKQEEEAKTKQMELAKLKQEEEAKTKQMELVKSKKINEEEDLGKRIKLEMVLIPEGKFRMGDTKKELEELKGKLKKELKVEKDILDEIIELFIKRQGMQHEVTLTNPYYLAKYEVTQDQWQAVMGDNPSSNKEAKFPVSNVSWEDCQEFIKKLNAKTDGGYRLPTEAEWEYACRAGTTTAFSFGEDITPKDANFRDSKIGKPVEVGSYKPNAFGLYDMHGNVGEWCEDWRADYLEEKVTNPKGPSTGEYRVLRGGSFNNFGVAIRSSDRCTTLAEPTLRNSGLGFRLARTADNKTAVEPTLPKPDSVGVIPATVNLLVAPFTETKVKEIQKEVAKILHTEVEEKEDLGKGVKLDLVLIPAGKFMMGSPVSEKGRYDNETQHEVTLTKPYYIGKYEVTQEQYEAVMGNNPSRNKGAKLPVTNVSWNDCQEFIKKLNTKTNGGYRLPTEAEWEFACRAGTKTAYSVGDSLTKADANIADSDGRTKAVGSYKPNAFGLYDLHGNVWEWCEDWYGDYPEGAAIDPKGPARGYSSVLRGGSFTVYDSLARSSYRCGNSPTGRNSIDGFRLAKTADTKAAVAAPKANHIEAMPASENLLVAPFSEAKAKEAQKATAKILQKGVEEKEDLGKGIKLEMVLIPAGNFVMGSPESESGRNNEEFQHEVTITKPYDIGKYKVTQEQWQAVMGNNPSLVKGPKFPVTNVSWTVCQTFIKNLNAKTNGGYRLPTEAEWEYACRAGTRTKYSFGQTGTLNDANYDGEPMEVGSYRQNAFGLHDMQGNDVWEWCEDWYGTYPAVAVTDPKGPLMGTGRVLRGRSSAYRISYSSPTIRNGSYGFRLVRTIDIKPITQPSLNKLGPVEVMPAKENRLVVPFTETKAKEVQKKVAESLQREIQKIDDLGKSVKLEMVLIPVGYFMMGSERGKGIGDIDETQHEVTLTKPYYMGKYEVTQEQWEVVMGNNPSKEKGPMLPVTDVSWEDCQEFIKKLNAKTDGGYRLPTEAEWEYACRAGTMTAYSFGETITLKDANGYGYSKIGKPVEVGSYKPNAFGLYDMHGNVREWCEDWYGTYPAGAVTNPKGPGIGAYRMLRGGSFEFPRTSSSCRDRDYDYIAPSRLRGNTGFRLAKSLDVKNVAAPTVPMQDSAEVIPTTGRMLVAPFTETKAKEIQKEVAKSLQKEVEETEDLGKKIKLNLVLIPAGKFMMGSPASEKGRRDNETQHEVTLTKPFYMGKYEVTREQWQAVMRDNSSRGSGSPITNVSWNDCQEFIKKLNARTNGGYRLPTEAEWEYACRAGTTTAYSVGDSLTETNANIVPKPAGSFKPNGFGLYHMHESAWEWCEDWKADYPAGAVTDPKGPATGENRVLRGGSFRFDLRFASSSLRNDDSTTIRNGSYGFRLARTP